MFTKGQNYTKEDIYSILDVEPCRQKGAWNTGYRMYKGDIFIFANVGVAGRTGHDYDNRWEGATFVWYGKTNSSVSQPLVRYIISNIHPVHIFTRDDDRAPYSYQGLGKAIHIVETTPVEVHWEIR
jgi:hypothetical protein